MRPAAVNLDRIAAFVSVADARSFTAAADLLGMTKSAVSQAVGRLERELGTQLLQRSTRKLAITEAGEAFLRDCRSLLTQAEQAVERARAGKARPTGLLRLSTAADSAAFVAPLLAEYLERFPEMRVEYVPTDRIVDLIAERFDLSLRTGAMQDSRLRALKLANMKMLTVAAPGYLTRHGAPRHPREFAAHQWVALSALDTPWSRSWRSRAGKSTAVRLKGSIAVATAAGARSLVLAGVGLSAFPAFMVEEDIAAGRLQEVLPQYRLPDIYLFAIWPGRLAPPAKTRAFIDLARDRLRKR
ncbi:MAG: LysR family transcriptional regulator [Betaproteobacteria bacterium]